METNGGHLWCGLFISLFVFCLPDAVFLAIGLCLFLVQHWTGILQAVKAKPPIRFGETGNVFHLSVVPGYSVVCFLSLTFFLVLCLLLSFFKLLSFPLPILNRIFPQSLCLADVVSRCSQLLNHISVLLVQLEWVFFLAGVRIFDQCRFHVHVYLKVGLQQTDCCFVSMTGLVSTVFFKLVISMPTFHFA